MNHESFDLGKFIENIGGSSQFSRLNEIVDGFIQTTYGEDDRTSRRKRIKPM